MIGEPLYSVSVRDDEIKILELEYFEEYYRFVDIKIKGYRSVLPPHNKQHNINENTLNTYLNGRVVCRQCDIGKAIDILYQHNLRELRKEERLVDMRKNKLKLLKYAIDESGEFG